MGDFLGDRLTTDAGVLLLREVDRALGLMNAVDECIPDPRDQRYVIHGQRSMLAQRVYAIALGYEDLNDHETLRVDPALQIASQREPDDETPLASPSTLCRLENRIGEQQLMLFADRTSCHEFEANQFRLLLSSLAYVLVQQLRQHHLAGTDLAKAQVDTIRLRRFKVAARVVVSVRRIVFHLATCYPYQTLFRDITSSLVLRPG